MTLFWSSKVERRDPAMLQPLCTLGLGVRSLAGLHNFKFVNQYRIITSGGYVLAEDVQHCCSLPQSVWSCPAEVIYLNTDL